MLDTVYDFIAENTECTHIFRGYQNRMALPEVQEYAVIALSDTNRIGTNVNDDTQGVDGIVTLKALREYIVDIDFCSELNARNWATWIEMLANSEHGIDFFKKCNINLNYAENMRYLPFVDGTNQYVERFRVTLHLTKWDELQKGQEYAERIEMNRVENIDTHHKF